MKLDLSTMTATRSWSYVASPAIQNNVLGDVQRLPNGNTLIAYSTAGLLEEVDASGNLLQKWQLSISATFGYIEKRATLYGPPHARAAPSFGHRLRGLGPLADGQPSVPSGRDRPQKGPSHQRGGRALDFLTTDGRSLRSERLRRFRDVYAVDVGQRERRAGVRAGRGAAAAAEGDVARALDVRGRGRRPLLLRVVEALDAARNGDEAVTG